MTKTTIEAPPAAGVQKGKVEKAGHYLSVVSTGLGICGALGTLFVWVAANFFVGDVEVKTDKPVESLIVKAYDRKGQEAVFHSPSFQLMPGKYHLDIQGQGAKTAHSDVEVHFGHKTLVAVPVIAGNEDAPAPDNGTRHWWQFWKK